MAYKSGTSTAIFNKHGLPVRWPRVWIIIIGLVLVFLTFAIAGMETGHTIYDVFRSTAFGGYIVFFPLLLCAIFVLITGKLTSTERVEILIMINYERNLKKTVFIHDLSEDECCALIFYTHQVIGVRECNHKPKSSF